MDVCLLGDCRTPLAGPAAKDILLLASRPGPPPQQRPSRLLPALHGANATESRKTYMAAIDERDAIGFTPPGRSTETSSTLRDWHSLCSVPETPATFVHRTSNGTIRTPF
ncbi:uncharacterized protein LOC134530299 [Bacillus rossius redtenbacheri]|uniref:uncharacterized protein LOC134530299 n=1 Tax=Bacillus rossius redtenbacheri TaxID=93214 RepID=UPI002FDE5F7C